MSIRLLKGVVIYNEYYAANLYLISPEIKTMAISLYKFVGPMGSQYNLICAGAVSYTHLTLPTNREV